MRVSVKNLDIIYKVMGEGRPLLILHGWGSSSDKWQKVGEILAGKGVKIIILDLPGFGNSDEPRSSWNLDNYCDFIGEFVKNLGIEKFSLLGHSFGGALAIKFSLKFPEKIDKLFLVGAACIRRKSLRVKLFKLISRIFKIKPLFLKKLFYRKSDYLSVEGVMRDTYLKIIAENLSSILSKVQVPTIIIWGDRDDITPLNDAYLIAEEIKRAKLEIIEKVGHNPHSESPKELSSLIFKELSSLK